jgi:hypothetical protein
MPPKRSAAAVTGGGPVVPSPSPKRVKVSAEPSRGTQQKLETFFTSPTKPKSQSAAGATATVTATATAKQLTSPLKRRPEVIVIGDEEEEHQISTCLPSEHSNERTPAAGNGSDCGAGPVIIPATPMEEDRLGVRSENSSMEEYGMDTDTLLARRLARADGIDIELARKLESGFQTGINKREGFSSAYSNVRALCSPFHTFRP